MSFHHLQHDIKLTGTLTATGEIRSTAGNVIADPGNSVVTNTIVEATAANGVVVDGILLKDNSNITNSGGAVGDTVNLFTTSTGTLNIGSATSTVVAGDNLQVTDTLSVDTIAELTGAAGVTIDGMLLKDGVGISNTGTVSDTISLFATSTGDINIGASASTVRTYTLRTDTINEQGISGVNLEGTTFKDNQIITDVSINSTGTAFLAGAGTPLRIRDATPIMFLEDSDADSSVPDNISGKITINYGINASEAGYIGFNAGKDLVLANNAITTGGISFVTLGTEEARLDGGILKVDTINELTASAGVTIEGIKAEDNTLDFVNSIDGANADKTLWATVGAGNSISIGGASSTTVIKGDLNVEGTTTTVQSNTLSVTDKNISLSVSPAPSESRNVENPITATTVTLDAGANATDDFYNGWKLTLTSGTGAPTTVTITDYVGATKLATVTPAYTTNPVAADTCTLDDITEPAAGNDTVADGGGLTLKSTDSNKTILWTNATDSWDFNQAVRVTGVTTDATDKDTGALIVESGGLGVELSAFVGGTLNAGDTINADKATGAGIVVDSSAASTASVGANALQVTTGGLGVGGNSFFGSDVHIDGTTAASQIDATVGALVVDGGVGIGGNQTIAGTQFVDIINKQSGGLFENYVTVQGNEIGQWSDSANTDANRFYGVLDRRIAGGISNFGTHYTHPALGHHVNYIEGNGNTDSWSVMISPDNSQTGTAQAGAATTITLAAGASAVDDFYNNHVITLTSGTGADQSKTITDYVGATKVATVDSAWATNPDATTTYIIREIVPTILSRTTFTEVNPKLYVNATDYSDVVNTNSRAQVIRDASPFLAFEASAADRAVDPTDAIGAFEVYFGTSGERAGLVGMPVNTTRDMVVANEVLDGGIAFAVSPDTHAALREGMFISSDSTVSIGDRGSFAFGTSPAAPLSVLSLHDVASVAPYLTFALDKTTTAANDDFGGIQWHTNDSDNGAGREIIANVTAQLVEAAGASSTKGRLHFQTRKEGTLADRMTIDEDGDVRITSTTVCGPSVGALVVDGGAYINGICTTSMNITGTADCDGAGGASLSTDGGLDVKLSACILQDLKVGTVGSEVLFADQSAGFVGIGTTSPLAELDVRGDVRIGDTTSFVTDGGALAHATKLTVGEVDEAPYITLYRRNTTSQVTAGEDIGGINFIAKDFDVPNPGDYGNDLGLAASIRVCSQETWSGSNISNGRMEFYTTDNQVVGERMRISSLGIVSILNTSATCTAVAGNSLQLSGGLGVTGNSHYAADLCVAGTLNLDKATGTGLVVDSSDASCTAVAGNALQVTAGGIGVAGDSFFDANLCVDNTITSKQTGGVALRIESDTGTALMGASASNFISGVDDTLIVGSEHIVYSNVDGATMAMIRSPDGAITNGEVLGGMNFYGIDTGVASTHGTNIGLAASIQGVAAGTWSGPNHGRGRLEFHVADAAAPVRAMVINQDGTVDMSNTDASTSVTTGTLQLSGGIGVTANSYYAAGVTIAGSGASCTAVAGNALQVTTGGLGVQGDSYFASALCVDGAITKTVTRATVFDDGDCTTWADITVHNKTDTLNAAAGIRFVVDATLASTAGAGIAAIKSHATNNQYDLAFMTDPSGVAKEERMRILHDGKVGVNTTTPQSIFHIADAEAVLTVQDKTTTAGAGTIHTRMELTDDANTVVGSFGMTNSDNLVVAALTAGASMQLQTVGADRITISSAGVVNVTNTSASCTAVASNSLQLAGGLGATGDSYFGACLGVASNLYINQTAADFTHSLNTQARPTYYDPVSALTVASATASNVTLSSDPTGVFTDWNIVVTAGTGVGQFRQVSVDAGATLTITPDWTTTLDATSVVELRRKHLEKIDTITVNVGTSTTIFSLTGASATVNRYKHWFITFTSGANAGETRQVTNYTSSTITVDSAYTATPSGGDTMVLTREFSTGDELAIVAGAKGGTLALMREPDGDMSVDEILGSINFYGRDGGTVDLGHDQGIKLGASIQAHAQENWSNANNNGTTDLLFFTSNDTNLCNNMKLTAQGILQVDEIDEITSGSGVTVHDIKLVDSVTLFTKDVDASSPSHGDTLVFNEVADKWEKQSGTTAYKFFDDFISSSLTMVWSVGTGTTGTASIATDEPHGAAQLATTSTDDSFTELQISNNTFQIPNTVGAYVILEARIKVNDVSLEHTEIGIKNGANHVRFLRDTDTSTSWFGSSSAEADLDLGATRTNDTYETLKFVATKDNVKFYVNGSLVGTTTLAPSTDNMKLYILQQTRSAAVRTGLVDYVSMSSSRQ